MSLDADLIVDRRRMRRKLTFWRVVTVLVAIVAVVGAGVAFTQSRRHHRRSRRRDRPDQHRGADPRQPAAHRGARAAGRFQRQGGDRPRQQPGRHRGRLRGALRLAGQGRGQEADGGRGRRPRAPPAAISPRWRPTTSWRSRAPSSARSACCSSIPISPSF